MITDQLVKDAGIASSTDKIINHGYEMFYPKHLNCICTQSKFGIVEIGYGEGNSIPFWKSIFPACHLYCFDKYIEKNGNGFNVFKCDQSDLSEMRHYCTKIDLPVRLIVDDGSHFPGHQIQTFNFLFEEILESGGVYIIEDIETSYWRFFDVYGYKTRFGIYHKKSAIEVFKAIIDFINKEYLSNRQVTLLKRKLNALGLSLNTLNRISEISFGKNCIIIHKKNLDAGNYSNREYFYPWRISSIPALHHYIKILYWKILKRKWPGT